MCLTLYVDAFSGGPVSSEAHRAAALWSPRAP